jgi:hypothetical protein
MPQSGSGSDANGVQALRVILTGELVTLAGGPEFTLDLAGTETLRAVLLLLAARVHRGFAALGEGGSEFPELGALTLLLNGQPVPIPVAPGLRAEPGTLYVIPPITGG